MTFAAKKDPWVVWMLAPIIVVALGAGLFFLLLPGGNAGSTGGGVVLLILGLFFLWGLLGTTYQVTSSHVIVRGGPLRHRIRIDQIVEAVPTISRRLVLGGDSFAFCIVCGRAHDQISDEEREEVVGSLRARGADLTARQDGLSASVGRGIAQPRTRRRRKTPSPFECWPDGALRHGTLNQSLRPTAVPTGICGVNASPAGTTAKRGRSNPENFLALQLYDAIQPCEKLLV